MTSGQSQVSLRSVSVLSVLTLSDRRSLKYFVLLFLVVFKGINSSNWIGLGILEKIHFRPEIWSFENGLQFVMVTRLEQP